MEWKTIESAPETGEVLLYQPAVYSERDKTIKLRPLTRVGRRGDWPNRPPSHWMPLPPPPKEPQ
jgi:hypothetical protein